MFTVFGANGFIGAAVCRALEDSGETVTRPPRGVDPATLTNMGHVLFCIGMTADFRSRPYETMEAHVTLPARILATGRFQSFLYLSSTRLYDGAVRGIETADIALNPANPSDLYNLSKLSGEALCLTHANPAVRVARLSNVYGSDMFADTHEGANFLASIIGEAISENHIRLGTHETSAKDYIAVEDVARALPLIATASKDRLVNVAAGRKISHGELVARLQDLSGCRATLANDAPLVDYPDISTDRIADLHNENGVSWSPLKLTDRLPALVAAARHKWNIKKGAVA